MVMADGYIEKRNADYEARKAAWQRRQHRLPKAGGRQIERPEDETL